MVLVQKLQKVPKGTKKAPKGTKKAQKGTERHQKAPKKCLIRIPQNSPVSRDSIFKEFSSASSFWIKCSLSFKKNGRTNNTATKYYYY